MSTAEKTLTILAEISEVEEVAHNLDLLLYRQEILDSMKTVELIVALERAFAVEISPAELDREMWATPAKIIAYMEQRVGP